VTKAQLARARRVQTVRALRKKLNMKRVEFATRFHLPLGTVRNLGARRTSPGRGGSSASDGHSEGPRHRDSDPRKL